MNTGRLHNVWKTTREVVMTVLTWFVVGGLALWAFVGYEPFMTWLTDAPISTSWAWLLSRDWTPVGYFVYGGIVLIYLGFAADQRLRHVVDMTIRQALREEAERQEKLHENKRRWRAWDDMTPEEREARGWTFGPPLL